MKIAYFQCFAGASGDMILGALLDAGLPLEDLKAQLATLKVPGFTLSREKAEKHHIRATQAVVTTEEQHAHRHLPHILEIIETSSISIAAKENAKAIFTHLAKAEGEVHGVHYSKVHFHEVGALDAIVDIIGAAVGLDLLGIEKIYASPLALGTGTIRAAHGIIPVPAPATVALLKGFPTVRTTIQAEMTTPTGAAIISSLASSETPPSFITTAIGYGAGNRSHEAVPNLVRLEIGTTTSNESDQSCVVLEANIDDMNPEIYGYVTNALMKAGALDVTLCPLQMKKGRPGVLLSVLATPATQKPLTAHMLRETTTIGVRAHMVQRTVLTRTAGTCETSLGSIAIKTVVIDGHTRTTPEYASCAKIADTKKIPLTEVYRIIAAELPQ